MSEDKKQCLKDTWWFFLICLLAFLLSWDIDLWIGDYV